MYLPRPPGDRERALYVDQDKRVLYALAVLSLISLATGMFLFATKHPYTWWYLPFALFLIVYLVISHLVGIFGRPFNKQIHQDRYDEWVCNGSRPTVDVYVTACNEPTEVILNTLLYASRINYENYRLHLLDDGHSERLRSFCEATGISYIARPNPGHMKKAGNLRYAFQKTYGEFILILDADFAPHRSIIDHLLCEMLPNTAIVQSPQFFSVTESTTWVQKGSAYVQELFYRLIQPSRDSHRAPICVGTCALYRRSALSPFGGTAPIEYSEDLYTGWMVQRAGWDVRYIPIALAKGLCPDTVSSYFTQQYRWSMGSLTMLTNKEFWTTKLTPFQRLSFLSGMLYYIASGLGVIFTPIPSVVMLYAFPEAVKVWNWIFVIPSFLFGTVYMALWSKHPFGFYALRSRHVAYWAHIFAMFDKLRGNLMPWVPTGTKATKSKRVTYFFYLSQFYAVLIFSSVISLSILNFEKVHFHSLPAIFFATLGLAVARISKHEIMA